MTMWALGQGYHEDNPNMKQAMEDYGVLEASVLSVLIRFTTLAIGIGLQIFNDHPAPKAVPIAFLLPMAAYPVIHNLIVIFMW